MADNDNVKESGSALVDEIKNAPTPAEISGSAPVVVEAEPAKTETVVVPSAPVASAATSAPVVDKAAADKIAAEKAAAEKAAKKAEKEAAKKQAKIDKKAKQAAEFQAKIEQCPKDYRPVTTGKFFWTMLLCAIPVVGLLLTIIFALIPINKNFRSFARAVLAWYVIGLILALIFSIIAIFVMGQSVSDIIWPFEKFFSDIAGCFGF